MVYETYGDTGYAPGGHGSNPQGGSGGDTPLFSVTNLLAGLISLGLIGGVGLWGYELLVRDVTGIPVVRAVQGEMRVKPDEPGGDLALHQGLAVNAVAADGAAEQPAEQLILAPQPVTLTPEDVPADPQSVAIVQQAVEAMTVPQGLGPVDFIDQSRVDQAVQGGTVEELVAALTAGVAPITPGPADQDPTPALQEVTPTAATDGQAEALQLAAAQGLSQSLRPRLRPARPIPASASAAPVAASTSSDSFVRDIDASALPAGTRLVQLGAYDSPAVAKREWDRFATAFGPQMANKSRVVQKATSGGKTFYRLRVMGFADLTDARAFCSVLTARGSDCIPVVTR